VRVLVGDATDHAHRVHAAVLARCTEDAWPEPARRCFVAEPDLHAGHRCQQLLAVDQRAVLARDVEAARLPPIDKLSAPCARFEELSQRIDACAAVDTSTRARLREVAARVLTDYRGLAAVRDQRVDAELAPNRAGGPIVTSVAPRETPRPVVVRRTINAPDPDGVRGVAIEPDTSECRLGVDTLIKLGADKCGW
jgi:hypothetical protein